MKKVSTFREHLDELLQNPSFSEHYFEVEAEYEIQKALIEARLSKKLTQQALASLSGIDQANLSRIEKGIANPSLQTLQRLAKALDMHIELKFIPNK
jgi:DNA-binding XRE family transcriptional regulator